MTAVISAPVTASIIGERTLLPMLLGFAALVRWKHRENIVRHRKGTVPRLGSKTSSTA
jgi:glycerol-3-phosphate acyltransferase PlsY